MPSKEAELLAAAVAAHAKALAMPRATPEPLTDAAEESSREDRRLES